MVAFLASTIVAVCEVHDNFFSDLTAQSLHSRSESRLVAQRESCLLDGQLDHCFSLLSNFPVQAEPLGHPSRLFPSRQLQDPESPAAAPRRKHLLPSSYLT